MKATIDNLDQVLDFVNTELEAIDCPAKTQTQINVIIDELFSNIAYYSYEEEAGEAIVSFAVREGRTAIILAFSDYGVPYNPLEAEDPDITLGAQERGIGGLGIYLVKNMVDDIFYEYKDHKNILTIRKDI